MVGQQTLIFCSFQQPEYIKTHKERTQTKVREKCDTRRVVCTDTGALFLCTAIGKQGRPKIDHTVHTRQQHSTQLDIMTKRERSMPLGSI